MKKPNRFCILSLHRSGTSLLVGSLNAHPQIVCHGEIFHKKPENHVRMEWRSQHEIGMRETDAVAFSYSILDETDPDMTVGFKMWRGQQKEACDAMLQDPSIFKIVLERTNILARYASANLAMQTGIWNRMHRPSENETRPNLGDKVEFKEDEFFKFVERHRETFAAYRDAKGPTLYITYEDLVKKGPSSVLNLLEVDIVPLPVTKQKLYSRQILGRFEAPYRAKIKKALEQVGHPEWIIEET